jgi:hypothetical protein
MNTVKGPRGHLRQRNLTNEYIEDAVDYVYNTDFTNVHVTGCGRLRITHMRTEHEILGTSVYTGRVIGAVPPKAASVLNSVLDSLSLIGEQSYVQVYDPEFAQEDM